MGKFFKYKNVLGGRTGRWENNILQMISCFRFSNCFKQIILKNNIRTYLFTDCYHSFYVIFITNWHVFFFINLRGGG